MQPLSPSDLRPPPRALPVGIVAECDVPVLAAVADRVIKGVLRRKIGPAASGRDLDDHEEISSRAIERVMVTLRNPQRADILDFEGYVATVANSLWSDYFREKNPHRYSAETKLLYLLSGRGACKDFAIWTDKNGNEVAGLARWSGRRLQEIDAHREFHGAPENLIQAKLPGGGRPRARVAKLFTVLGGPALLTDLKRAAGLLLELPVGNRENSEPEPSDPPPSTQPKEILGLLWKELGDMPLKHRTAFLLNCDLVFDLDAEGVASIRQIAAMLEISAADFARLWADLPLPDAIIAERLGMERQQVINLRMIARRWLKPALRCELT